MIATATSYACPCPPPRRNATPARTAPAVPARHGARAPLRPRHPPRAAPVRRGFCPRLAGRRRAPVVQIQAGPGRVRNRPRCVVLRPRHLAGAGAGGRRRAARPALRRQPAGDGRAAHPLLRRRAGQGAGWPSGGHAVRDRHPAAPLQRRGRRGAARPRRTGRGRAGRDLAGPLAPGRAAQRGPAGRGHRQHPRRHHHHRLGRRDRLHQPRRAARSDGADRTVSGRRRDGDVFPMELAISAFSCVGQRGYAGIVRDVSDARRRQRELLAATRDAELAAQAKGDFLANMSHEIRSPLNAILGLSHLLGTTPLSADQRGYLDMVASSGQSLLAILNDILDFSKIEAGQMALAPAPVLLSELLRPLATMMSVTAGDKDLELLIGVAPGVPPAYVGDPLRLHQVLLNLLANAIKFTERGAVTLLVDCPARRDSSAALRFRVRDSGIGISAEQQGRLFQAFTQADTSTTRRFGGTGLGLSIAHRLATMMGGTIKVDSELGRGSEFFFELDLPLAPDGAVAPAAPPCDAGLRVLLAGDHAGANSHLADMVAPWRWSLTEAGSGTQALALLLAAAGDGRAYDLLLVDGNSAAVDAPALLRALQDAPPAGGRPLTILMANAYARGKLVQAGAPGIDASLTKPAIAANLLHALAQARTLRRDGAAGPGASGPPAARHRVAGRFLLVEDNLLNQIVASGLLRRAGAEVDIAANGQQALELLRAAPQRYQMVLMDVQMPVMDGIQATRAIRQQLALTLPVIAMTAGVLDNERRQCLDAGMSDFIAKPLDLDAMFATLARHLPASTPPGPPTAARGPQAPADDAVFDVEQLCPADEPGTNAGMVDLIARILAEAQAGFDTANAAWRGGDPLLAARTLHAMRGNIGALGASRFVRASRLAEAALAEQPAELITPLFDDAGAALAEALAAGAAWLAGKRAPIL